VSLIRVWCRVCAAGGFVWDGGQDSHQPSHNYEQAQGAPGRCT
jgi:hypothetical protein